MRNFENAIREMLARGHEVTVAVELVGKRDDRYAGLVAELEREGVTFCRAPRSTEASHRVGVQIRLGLDFLRYLDPRYGESSKLRARASRAAPGIIRAAVSSPLVSTPAARAGLGRALAALDAAAPVSASVEGFLDKHRPDVLLVTPLVELGAPQTDWLRAARVRGIPTALGVASWDNLTVKGGLREWPDLILVWNQAQVREATELHGVPGERLVATGAHTYDHWFAWRSFRTRVEFCAETGLDSERPFLLYLCSSPFIAPGEVDFVRDWIAGLRASRQPELHDVGVLVRPHPQHAAQWNGQSLADLGNAVIWPHGGADPVGRDSRSDYFDSMIHCSAVVGINTSAQIESAIAGRNVFTLLDARFAPTQGGTLHFAHLAEEEGGLLYVASDVDTHHEQLVACLQDEGMGRERRDRFLRSFVRPHGLSTPTAPLFVSAVEALQQREAPPVPASPTTMRRLNAWWRMVPWRLVGVVLAVTDHRARARLARTVRLFGSALRRPHPPRTVAELAAPPSPAVTARVLTAVKRTSDRV